MALYDLNMRLSANYTLNSYLRGNIATSNNIREQFSPPTNILTNINYINLRIQKIRDIYGKELYISSGYRCERVNKLAGGVKNSEHLLALGVDLSFGTNINDGIKIAEIAIKNGCKRVGLGSSFIHLGFSTTLPQNVVFMYGSKTPARLKAAQPTLIRLMSNPQGGAVYYPETYFPIASSNHINRVNDQDTTLSYTFTPGVGGSSLYSIPATDREKYRLTNVSYAEIEVDELSLARPS